jgi:hypothetical protein
MTSVTIKAVVDEERQLHIALPEDMPLGPVEVTITPIAIVPELAPGAEPTREQLRALLGAEGTLSAARFAPPDARPLSEEEREELAQLFAGEPSISDMIIADRRERWG